MIIVDIEMIQFWQSYDTNDRILINFQIQSFRV